MRRLWCKLAGHRWEDVPWLVTHWGCVAYATRCSRCGAADPAAPEVGG